VDRFFVNPAYRPGAVPPPDDVAYAYHRSLAAYRPTPVRDLPHLGVRLKDESDRLGLPAFKILGASWAVELALRAKPDTEVLVAASAGNHGRAVARAAARRGLACRVYLPERSLPARRGAIEGEGAEVVVVDGTYEDAVARAREDAVAPGAVEIADVGDSPSARAVIDGYATLFAELGVQAPVETLVVPVGVGSLAAAAARFGAATGARVVGVEPSAAARLTASLEAGERAAVPTPGTVMAGMDCAELSPAAWPALRDGVYATVTVDDTEIPEAEAILAGAGLELGECAAATVAALSHFEPGPNTMLIATEGRTGQGL
jgi:diaminopropionate ammonia-lyase